jgi:hypothetical protein
MKKHRKHSASDLDDALEHVIYEMWKYRQSIAHYGPISKAGGDAALEFRVLHHRILLEFFYGSPMKHPDNIFAWEYVDGWERMHLRAGVPWLDSYMTRCHTMLAHISTKRTEWAKRGLKNWGSEWPRVEPHLNQIISDFLNSISSNHKAICSRWMSQWLAGPHVGNDVLETLIREVRPTK